MVSIEQLSDDMAAVAMRTAVPEKMLMLQQEDKGIPTWAIAGVAIAAIGLGLFLLRRK